MFSVDLTEASYSWKKVTDTKGTVPSPRYKHSCWVHRDRSVPPPKHMLPGKGTPETPFLFTSPKHSNVKMKKRLR